MIGIAYQYSLALVVLVWMRALTPVPPPWADTYPATAQAIADESEARPLFRGAIGPMATAALLTAVAWFESSLNPRAVGDQGESVCLAQIGRSNLPTVEGWDAGDLLEDTAKCVAVERRMIAESLRVCRDRPVEEQLGHYAAGRGRCEAGAAKSRHRWALARRLAGER